MYVAEDLQLKRPVAIFSMDLSKNRDEYEEVAREFRAMQLVRDDPRIVTLYEAITSNDRAYIVAEYVGGGSLEEQIRQLDGVPMPLERSLQIAVELCGAMEAVHQAGLVHGDIKPGNVLMTEDGHALLSDFGFARFASDPQAVSQSEDESRSGAVGLLGTPDYIAPESIGGKAPGSSADLYSFGCVLYELLTGHPPFRGRDSNETLRLHQLGKVTAPRSVNPEVSPILSELVLLLLEKDPGDRPDSARDIGVALESIGKTVYANGNARASVTLDSATGSASRYSDSGKPLIGRRRERVHLRRSLDYSEAGGSQFILIRGVAGIGKSELVRELGIESEARGAAFLSSSGDEEASYPFRGFVEALLPLSGMLSRLESPVADRFRDFLYLEIDSPERVSYRNEPSAQHGMYLGVYSALSALSQLQQLVVVLDDLHWMDPASIDLLLYLLERRALHGSDGDFNVTLVACMRPVGPDHPLSSAEKRMRSLPATEILDLEAFDDSAVYEMLIAMGCGRPSDQLLQVVQTTTGGNPLFVRELYQYLDEGGALQELNGFTSSIISSRDSQLPATAAKAIAGRIENMSESCQGLLATAALVASRLDETLLCEVAGRPKVEVARGLREAEECGLLVRSGASWGFVHPVVHEVLRQSLDVAERERIHLRVADALSKEKNALAPDRVSAIAHHLVAAGRHADRSKVFVYARSAAEQAAALFAWRDAAKLYHAAIEVATEVEECSQAELGELYRSLAYVYHCLADPGPCLHYYDLAIEALRDAGESRAVAVALSGKIIAALRLGLVAFGELGDVKPLEQMLESLGDEDPSLQATLLGTLAERYWGARRQDRARDLSAAALTMAERVGDHSLCARVSRQVGLADFQSLHVTRALEQLARAKRSSEVANDAYELSQCEQRIGLYAVIAGDLECAEDALRASHDPSNRDVLLKSAIAGSIAVVRGTYPIVEGVADETLAKIRIVKEVWAGALLFPALACSRMMRNNPVSANVALDLLEEPGLVFGDTSGIKEMSRPLRRLIDVLAGADLESYEFEVRGVEAAEQLVDMLTISGLCAQVEIANASSRSNVPTLLVEALRIADDRGVVFTPGWPFMIKRVRGLVAHLRGCLDEAENLFKDAVDIAERIGASPDLARGRFDYAQMLVLRDDPGDWSQARDLISLALPDLRRFAPQRFVSAAEKLENYFLAST